MSLQIKKAVGVAAGLLLALCTAQATAQTVARQGKVIPDQYIVVLKKSSQGGGLLDIVGIATPLLGKYGGQLLGSLGVNLPGFIAHLTPAQAASLAKDPKVSYVEQDQVVKAVATQKGATWGLDRVDQREPSLDREYHYPDKAGEGAHVYIVDTGIRASHAEFKGRVGTGRNFAPNSGGGGLPLPIPIVGDLLGGILGGGGGGGGGTDPENVADCNGHGTHVAGSAAGSTYGVAKKATVHAVRVLACDGSGSNSGVIQGVDWVAQNAQKPAVANLSLGGGNSKALDDAVKNAIRKDITFVVAAGNDNKDACQGSPNRVAEAITVGATTKSDQRSDFSNWGSCVDLFAPGSDITSAWFSNDSATQTISGTSMASPHVAGVAALYLAANTRAAPKDVAKALVGRSSEGKVGGVKGSPNKLAYVAEKGDGDNPPGEPAPDKPDDTVFKVKCEGLSCDFSTDTGNEHYWDFGDGGKGSGARVTHAYDKAGLYEVSLAYTTDKARKETRIVSVEKPKSEPEPEPIPCEGCDKHAGSLSGPGQTAYHPGAEGASSAGGSFQAFLRGPANTDFDFFLERRKSADGGGGGGGGGGLLDKLPGLGSGSKKKDSPGDGNWEIVASGETTSNNERISADVGEGVYRWRVISKKGSGGYQLYVRNP